MGGGWEFFVPDFPRAVRTVQGIPDDLGSVHNRHGERLAVSHTPGRVGDPNLVVIGHGLTSDRERPWSQVLAAGLAARGIASLRIAFSGNGDSGGRFEDSTLSKEVEDLGAVLDALGTGANPRVAYIGHSMGAAVGLVRAASDARILALVSLAGIAHPRAFFQRLFGHLEPGAVMLGKPHCRLARAFADDMTSLETLRPKASALRIPWLLVHGDRDEIVLPQDSIDLHQAAQERPELVLLPGADHSFTGAALQAMTAAVVPWLEAKMQAKSL